MNRTLEQELEYARKREDNDDHLSDEQRDKLVKRYRLEYPDVKLPDDMTSAYVEMLS